MSHVQAIQASGILFKEITRRGGKKKRRSLPNFSNTCFSFQGLASEGMGVLEGVRIR